MKSYGKHGINFVDMPWSLKLKLFLSSALSFQSIQRLQDDHNFETTINAFLKNKKFLDLLVRIFSSIFLFIHLLFKFFFNSSNNFFANFSLQLILLVSATCLMGSAYSAGSSDVTASATTAKPQGFAARSIEATDEEDEFESQAQTHLAYRQQQQPQQRQLYDYSQSEEDQEEAPRQIYQSRNVKQQSNYLKQNKKPTSEEESEEEVEEEPDRLSLLLAKSSFNCNSKNSGLVVSQNYAYQLLFQIFLFILIHFIIFTTAIYNCSICRFCSYYADESLNCEVFHYCQDNQRHSWICPEGFTFHQIHLICMPPSHDNICQQSSKYHIVNDYLYKPINLQEHQSKPNVTLRYSERYYPENYYENDRYEDEEEAPRQRVNHQRQPVSIQEI